MIALDVGDDGDPGVEIVEAAVEFACLGDEMVPPPEWLPPPSWGTVPPMTKLGSTPHWARAKPIMALVVDLPWVPATATPNRSPMTSPSISAYLTVLRPRVGGGDHLAVFIGHGGGADDEINFGIEQFAELIQRDFCTFSEEFDGMGTGAGSEPEDDGAGVEEHSGQAAHAAAAYSDKMHALTAELTCGGRIRSLVNENSVHAIPYRTTDAIDFLEVGIGKRIEPPVAKTPERRNAFLPQMEIRFTQIIQFF